ncbi:MAG: YjgP/YjgQ family permease [Ferruginibacter sp.]|nr:YjgP/YjgQ family permease [Ferruginibacter sp.]
MIKKLDQLILRSFIGPFIATFFIAFFVLMMQSLWKYIDDLVGKDLDLITIGKFLWYASASLLTLAMPIAILISSIMTFGNLGESFELVAIKSAGISLLRFMRPLMLVAIFLCGITFLFANYVIPYANLKFKTLYYDITYKKPALDLKQGTFYNHIPGYAIKVGKKDSDGKTIHNVLIYEQQYSLQDNSIIAEKGTMGFSGDKKFLEFTLYNGFRYQERGNAMDTSTEFIRLGFKEYKKLFDLSSLQMMNTPDSIFKNDYKMLSIRQLNKSIDSLGKAKDSFGARFNNELTSTLHYNQLPDSLWKKVPPVKPTVKSFASLIPDSARFVVYENTMTIATTMKNSFQFSGAEWDNKKRDLRNNQIEWHRKFSLSLACLVLFFIGAPLGSIIRKGGLGMPLVVAIIFFLIFHLLNMFGEKFVKDDITSPFIGMWLSILVLAPLGALLTYKAMHDSQLFNKEFYYRFFKSIRPVFKPVVNIFTREKKFS